MRWMSRAVGIDLGTTNSTCALLSPDGQRVVIAEDRHGRTVIPSAVSYVADEQRLVAGFEAWNRRGLEPEPITSVKRKMGLPQSLALGPLSLTPAEVSAAILRDQVERMAAQLARQGGELRSPTRAVVTVPAYFDAPQIEATREAGELAGLEVLGLLQEPTAAAMYAVWANDLRDGTFLVYDLGGGTFDVSVIRCLFGEYQVLGLDGDNVLGGDDFDRRLAEHFRAHLARKGYALELDVAGSREDALRLLLLSRAARQAKEALSAQDVYYAAHRDLLVDQAGTAVTLELEVSRASFEGLIEDLVDASVRCCERALAESERAAGVALADIDHVLLVGGSTRIPLVQRKVLAALCGEGRSRAQDLLVLEPDRCVALGAAIHAANLGGLELGDDEASVTVRVTSPLSTVRDQARLSAVLTGEGCAGVSTVLVRDERGAALAVESLPTDGHLQLASIPLPEPGAHVVTLDLLDAAGTTVCEVPITLHRADAVRRTGSALSNPTVLAKDISLEVRRRGELDRQVVVARGRPLPHQGHHRFFTGDQSGAVVLNLLQSRYPIRTIHLDVGRDLPVGTPVELSIEVDEKMVITANGAVGGHTFWATVEAPEVAPPKDWEATEALLDEAQSLGSKLWGLEAHHYRREVPFLASCIREAARTDPDKMHALSRRLEGVLEELRGTRSELSPGLDHYERLLDNVRRIVLRADAMLGLDFDAWQRRLQELRTAAQAAWDARNELDWHRAHTQVQALYETVSQEESRFVRTNSLEHVESLFQACDFRLGRLRTKLQSMVMPNDPETRHLRAQGRDELARAVEAEVGAALGRLSGRLEASTEQRAELERIMAAARALEAAIDALPGLGVVVSER